MENDIFAARISNDVVQSIKEWLWRKSHQTVNEYYDCVNGDDKDDSILPHNKYKVYVYPGDHMPPHCHVQTSDKWDISYRLSDGAVVHINKVGKKKINQKQLQVQVIEWLNAKSVSNPRLKNRQVLYNLWKQFYRQSMGKQSPQNPQSTP